MFGMFNKKEDRSVTASSTFWSFFTADAVNDKLRIGTVYSCVRMLSDSISMTPIKVFKKTDQGREQLDNNIAQLLNKPAQNTSYFQWLNAMTVQLSGWGNAYSVIEYENGIAKSLVFIPSENVSIQKTQTKEPYFYKVTTKNNKIINVFPDEMIHFRNITVDGVNGLSPIGLHDNTFDRSHYETEFATNFAKNGSSISGIISTEKKLKQEQITQLKKDFNTAYSGSANAGKVPVLGDGLKFDQVKPVSPADSDYVNSNRLTDNQIMRIFKIPPPILGVIDSTYNNTEQLALIYQRYTLAPLYEMIQQELTLKLVSRSNTYIEFVVDALLNATAKDKVEVITKLTEKGVMTLNEARRKYNMQDKKGLDDVILPLSLAPLPLHNEVLKPVEPVVTPPADETPPKDDEDEDQLRSLVHKLQSDLGRIKKQLGNGNA